MKKRRIKLWLMCGLTLLVSLFSVLTDLIKFDGITNVPPWFWFNLVLTNLSAVVIIFLSNSTEKDLQMMKNDRYITLSNSLFDMYKELNLHNLRTAFADYIARDNAREKKEIYYNKINKKIAKYEVKIEKRISRYNMWRIFFRKPIVDEPHTLELVFLRGRLDFWRKRLETAEKDVKYAYVHYLRVTEDSIFGANDEKGRKARDMSCHTAGHNLEILVRKFLIVFVFGFATSLGFTFAPVVWTGEFIYKMAMRLFQLGMALFTGISDADRFVEVDMCDALSRRISYVQGFKENLLKK